jgi:hypothetical protein
MCSNVMMIVMYIFAFMCSSSRHGV